MDKPAEAQKFYELIQSKPPNSEYAKRASLWMETRQPLPTAQLPASVAILERHDDGFSRWRREVGKWVLLSAALVTIILIFQFGVGGWPPLPMIWRDIVLGFTVCASIFALGFTIIPRVAQRVRHHHVIFRWAGLIAAMIACGAAGLSLAIIALALAGILPAKLMTTVFRENIIGVTTTTIIVGTTFTIFESTKMRLEATELELQTQRLERARAEKLTAEARAGIIILASAAAFSLQHAEFNLRTGSRRSGAGRAYDRAALFSTSVFAGR